MSDFFGFEPEEGGGEAPAAHAITHGVSGSDPVFLDASQVVTGIISSDRLPPPMGTTVTMPLIVNASGTIPVSAGMMYYTGASTVNSVAVLGTFTNTTATLTWVRHSNGITVTTQSVTGPLTPVTTTVHIPAAGLYELLLSCDSSSDTALLRNLTLS